MTVKEAFEKAYGPLPDSTCHIGVTFFAGTILGPSLADDIDGRGVKLEGGRWCKITNSVPAGPDISDRPASAFIGFFGPEYDKAVEG